MRVGLCLAGQRGTYLQSLPTVFVHEMKVEEAGSSGPAETKSVTVAPSTGLWERRDRTLPWSSQNLGPALVAPIFSGNI